uniref:DNA-binding protein RFX8 n=1 Tax=Latimeria chalumnae TaxID=7897 RepID=M3XK37_LATCH|nr:PREDICTED: DNA-binding protein RFX8 isoform X2 [Latimeria chalumnae]|eukprot:XP_014348133.1 PREDICTED: DNA-binding protein RFX8 isoform X2 [Latimeria chalumnae]
MAEASPRKSSHSATVQWLVDHFHVSEGCSIPRCLLYEFYLETCGQNIQNRVNAATFGKLVRTVFTDLGTRRLGTRGSARYHYDGIHVKKSSPLYSHFCCLLKEKRFQSVAFFNNEKTSFSVSGGNTAKGGTQSHCYTQFEFKRLTFWEQELEAKYSSQMFILLADEYYNYCQDILQNVRNKEFDRVEDLVIFFWKSLPFDAVTLMSLPDVCQLFNCYDAQLYKVIEKTLIDDFLEDVSVQYLKTARHFSKKFKSWLLNALESFPPPLQMSKNREVTMLVNRIRRKTCLSNLAKTMRMVFNDSQIISMLKTDLDSIITQNILEIPTKTVQTNFSNLKEVDSGMELKCLNSMLAVLGSSTEIRIYLNVVSSFLQEFVFQPSKNKEEFIQLAANFQLRWNYFLTSISRAMTLFNAESFGSWHLLNLLLLEYVNHVLQSYVEMEEVVEGQQQDPPLHQTAPELDCLLEVAAEQQAAPGHPPKKVDQSSSNELNLDNISLKVMGFLVDTSIGCKVIQIMLEDHSAGSSVKVNVPVGQEAVITLKDGQKFVIHTSNILPSDITKENQSTEN